MKILLLDQKTKVSTDVCLSYHTHYFMAPKDDSRTHLPMCQGNSSISLQFSFLSSAGITSIFLS